LPLLKNNINIFFNDGNSQNVPMPINDIQHNGPLKTMWKSLFISLLITLFSLPSIAKDELAIAVGLAKPPYVIQSNNTGFEIELIRNTLAIVGKSSEFVYTSFGHSSKMLTVDEIDAVMTTNSRMFHDSTQLSDVYITYTNVAISLKDKNLTIESIADLANYSIASFQNANKVLGDEFENAVNQSPLFLQVADQKRQPTLLLKGRVDVVVMDKNIFNFFANELKIENLKDMFTFHNVFSKSHYRMAFKNPKNAILFNQAFAEYSKSESYKALLQKYKL